MVADSGGGAGGDDLFTLIDKNSSGPDTPIGGGTGTSTIESIAYDVTTGILYAANANRLGTINVATGVFAPAASTFGSGPGSAGTVTFSDVDGMAFALRGPPPRQQR
jgi:hypothetical protein